MPRKKVTGKNKEEIRNRVRREFPGCKSLQDIHYYRYMKEIEWETMTHAEIVADIRRGASEIKKEMKTFESKMKRKPVTSTNTM